MDSPVVVTGVNGFVGHHMARELHQQGIAVIGIGREPTATAELAGLLESYISADLATTWPLSTDVSAIIHLAGLAEVAPSFDDPQRYISINSAMVTRMGEAYVGAEHAPRILIVSSGTVYDPAQPMPLTEQSAVSASSPYAVSKLLVESQAEYYRSRGLDCIVARPFNHIGPGQVKGIVPDLAAELLSADRVRPELTVGNLDARRDYTDARDVVRAYRLLVTTPSLRHTLYNVCSNVSLSGHDLLQVLRSALDLPDITTHVDPARLRPNDHPNIHGSFATLQADTGWQPTIAIDQTVKDYLLSISKS